jgi:hypothetical protein
MIDLEILLPFPKCLVYQHLPLKSFLLPVLAEAYIELCLFSVSNNQDIQYVQNVRRCNSAKKTTPPNPPEQSSCGRVIPLIPPRVAYNQMTKSHLFSFSADLESPCNTPAYGVPERTFKSGNPR